jgi:Ni,Fe-hydrogenase maturation factor
MCVMPKTAPILVAVCGNADAGDDALGPLVAGALHAHALLNIEVLNLGLRPAALLDHLPDRHALLLVDAVQLPGVPAGRIVECDWSAAIPLSRPDIVGTTWERVAATIRGSPPGEGASGAVKRAALNVKRSPSPSSRYPLPVTRYLSPPSTHGLSLSDQVELARRLGILPPVVRFLGVTLGTARLGRPPSVAVGRQAPILARRIARWCRAFRAPNRI